MIHHFSTQGDSSFTLSLGYKVSHRFAYRNKSLKCWIVFKDGGIYATTFQELRRNPLKLQINTVSQYSLSDGLLHFY